MNRLDFCTIFLIRFIPYSKFMMSETRPARMPTAPQPGLKDTPNASNHDSNSKTPTDTPFGDLFSNDGVCGAAAEENSPAVKRKVEQLQAPSAKKARVCSALAVYSPTSPAYSPGYLPAVLVNPCRPVVKRIKREYNRRVSALRCSIPDAYYKIKNFNYEIRKLTAPAEISRVRSELKKNHAIILRAQCQMRTAHQEKKRKLENVKTIAVFRYLSSKEKRVAKVAIIHQWSPFKPNE